MAPAGSTGSHEMGRGGGRTESIEPYAVTARLRRAAPQITLARDAKRAGRRIARLFAVVALLMCALLTTAQTEAAESTGEPPSCVGIQSPRKASMSLFFMEA